jgi:tyrosine-specific transport protein
MDKKDNRLLGGILLIGGTSVGAGMLALPVSTAFGGFIPSIIVFFICWAFMLLTAFFFLEVNLAIRGEPNLVSMAGKTLGTWGKSLSWVFYLLLLYSLLAAYIAGCTPLFQSAFTNVLHITFPKWFYHFILPAFFGGFVYLGTKGVDYINRFLMIGLVLSYFLLVGYCPSFIETPRLLHQDYLASLLSVPIVITSFGYHIIIPTLTTYLDHDVKRLRKALLIGSSIPFVIYMLWQWIILGSVPLTDLAGAWKQGLPATVPLSKVTAVRWIGVGAQFFSFFAIVTSFLGVSLSLCDFLKDGLKIKKTWEGRLLAIALTFVPPLIFIFAYPKSFYMALEYAGIFVVVLLGILPSLMVLKLKTRSFYRKRGGRFLVYFVLFLCLSMIILNSLEKFGFLQHFITPYVQ